ncbi:MAG TPA: ABC transporter permease [Vicinamibacteria bacterium]|nr:ABC transporter permease [Vicinamibacteria bacterium]
MERALRDLRLAARSWRRSPALAVAAVVTLGVALGANTALFSLVNAVLLRPLPGIANADRLVNVHRTAADGATFLGLSAPDYRDLRERTRALDGLAAFNGRGAALGDGDGAPELVGLQLVTGNFFDVLGVRARHGRLLAEGDDAVPGASAVAVISDALWRSRFGGDPLVVGRTIRLNGFPFTVVGVGPEGFQGHFVGFPFEVWVPLAMAAQAAPGEDVASRDNDWLELVGRLAPGRTVAQAQADLATVMSGLAREHPGRHKDATADVRRTTGVDDSLRGAVVSFLAVLQAVAALVLLIACVNLAGLLLARAAGRARDVALRLALGASRAALVRQLMAEALLLLLAGGAFGVALAAWAADLLHAFQPGFVVPLRFDLGLDVRVLAFAALATLVAGVAFGLVPALQASRLDLASALRDGRAEEGGTRARARRALVVGQIALSMVLLVAAGLFVRTLQRARVLDPGFGLDGVTTARLDLTLLARDETHGRAFYDRLLERLLSLPGAQSASLTTWIPLRSLAPPTAAVHAQAEPPLPAAGLNVPVSAVTPAYFETMRIPLLAGRAFSTADGPSSRPVAVISEALARRLWPGAEAAGRRLRHGSVEREVVGVARDVKMRRLTEETSPHLYVPLAQAFTPRVRVLLRARGDLALASAALRREVAGLEQDLPVMETMPLREAVALALFPQRMAGTIASALGALGLGLAATGLYGLVAWSVSRRTREMGVRVALGASRRDLLGLVLAQGLRLALAGVALGALGAAALAQGLRGLLPGVSPTDPLTFVAIAVLMTAVALLASYLPARRAARVDPMTALRTQ